MTKPVQNISMSFSSSFLFMETVHQVINEIFRNAGFTEDERYELTIAVREAITNAIKHGNKLDPAKEVSVLFALGDDRLSVEVSDRGDGFDLDEVPDPTLPENRLKAKGRGIYYIRSFMDEVDFDIVPERGTTIKMVKRRQFGTAP